MITIAEIDRIIRQYMKLLSYTEFLKRDVETKEADNFAQDILASMRKLLISSMMYNKKLICISGLQGAGKTTLMKNFYGMDGSYLTPTRGRGERIPILITEKPEITNPVMYAIKIEKGMDGEYNQQNVEIKGKDLDNALAGENAKIMYLELYVPYKHTFNQGVSFVLLPGFEKKNDYWSSLIEFSVNSSDAAVFVFNETSFSNADNDRYLRRIEKKFGDNLVYAISGSDGSPDDNKEVKEICIKTLNIPSNEEDRVVCVGEYADDEKKQEWIKKFKAALEKYAYQETQQFRRNSEYLYQEILKIEDNLYRILDIVNEDNSAEIQSHQNDTLLRVFDKVVEDKRKIIEKNLDEEFSKACGQSIDSLQQCFSEQNKNKIDALKQHVRHFFGSTIEDQFIKPKKRIQESLKYKAVSSEIEEFPEYKEKLLPDICTNRALKRSLRVYEGLGTKTYLHKLLVSQEFKDGQFQVLVNDEKILALTNDIRILLQDHSYNHEIPTLQSTYHKQVFGAIAEIGTYYFSLFNSDHIADLAGFSYYEPEFKLSPDMVLQGAETSKKFAVGLAGLMGIDVLGDGSLNFITQIATQFGVAVPVAGVAAIGIIGTGAAAAVLRDINRMQRNSLLAEAGTIDSIYNNLKMNILDKFDTYMAEIRNRIEDNITVLSGDGNKMLVEYNAKIVINNMLNLLKATQDKVRGDSCGIESII